MEVISACPGGKRRYLGMGALSHAGLTGFCTTGDMGETAQHRAPIMFAMSFLIHPFVFFMFGRGMERGGEMRRLPAYLLALRACWWRCWAGLGRVVIGLRSGPRDAWHRVHGAACTT